MKYRKLGSTGLEVSEIAFGCNKLGSSIFDSKSEEDNIRIVKIAIEKGINLFDTAPTYNYGNSEKMLGIALKEKRKDIIISSKVGRLSGSIARYGRYILPFSKVIKPLISPFKKNLKKSSKNRFDFSEEHITKTIDQSLVRLKTDYIDIIQLHNPSQEIIERGDVFEILEKLKKQGKINHYGLSISTFDEASVALNYPISTLQLPYNLVFQSLALKIFSIDSISKIGIMVNTPLLRGLLTDKNFLREEYFSEEINKNIKLKKLEIDKLVGDRQINHLALQFILENPHVSTILCGTSSPKNLSDNLKYDLAPPISTSEWETINAMQEKFPI